MHEKFAFQGPTAETDAWAMVSQAILYCRYYTSSSGGQILLTE